MFKFEKFCNYVQNICIRKYGDAISINCYAGNCRYKNHSIGIINKYYDLHPHSLSEDLSENDLAIINEFKELLIICKEMYFANEYSVKRDLESVSEVLHDIKIKDYTLIYKECTIGCIVPKFYGIEIHLFDDRYELYNEYEFKESLLKYLLGEIGEYGIVDLVLREKSR